MDSNINAKERIIKRYVNRKLYDTELSRYVTIEEVAEHIKNGVSVRIFDNKTGEDITSTTLLQIILDAEKKNRVRSSSSILESVIKTGTLSEFLHGYSSSVKNGIEEAEHWLSKILDSNQKFWSDFKEQIKGINNNKDGKKIEEYGKKMEEYYRSTVERIKYTTNREKTKAERELINLRQKVVEMETKLKKYEESKKRRISNDED